MKATAETGTSTPTVPTKLVIHYGTYAAPEAEAAVLRSIRCHLEQEPSEPFDHDELREEAVLLRAVLDQRIGDDVDGGRSGRRGQ